MADPSGDLLILNVGSSSIKFSIFDADLHEGLNGAVTGIGTQGLLELGETRHSADLPDHHAALDAVLRALETRGMAATRLRAVGHRVVHGGTTLTAPARITTELRDEIARCVPLAPLHNPHQLAAIDAMSGLAPHLPQVACFDTAFHATNPDVATYYALPADCVAAGIRRYGFHGLSYDGLTDHLQRLAGTLPSRVLAFHLGNGASACAILDGQSVASSMGYSPTDGLTMGTRSGSIDPMVVLRFAEERGIEGAAHLLNHKAGLAGLSGGLSDMRALEASDDPAAAFAIDHFIYWACRHGGSLVAAMQGVDAIVFTGGIGEHSARVRAGIAQGLGWLGARIDVTRNARNAPRLDTPDSALSIWVIPADEERVIARAVLRVMDAG